MAFITLEGSEGVGKSTALAFIQQYLEDKNLPFVFSREPGGTPMAEKIRSLLLEEYQEQVAAETEALLFFAGRKQNIINVILPALLKNKWVICDRFNDASYAYQGGGRGINFKFLDALTEMVQLDLKIDLTLLLDAPVEVGMERAKNRSAKADRIEQEAIDFFERVRKAYLDRAKQCPERFTIIDATQSVGEVSEQIRIALDRLL